MPITAVCLSTGRDSSWWGCGTASDSRGRLRRAATRSGMQSGDLPQVAGGQRDEIIAYGGQPSTDLQRRLRRGVATDLRAVIHDHITRAVRSDDAQAYALMRPGQTYDDLPEGLQRYRSDIFHDKYKRLEWGQIGSDDHRTHRQGRLLVHPSSQDRTLSIREAARLQTFPDWYRFGSSERALSTDRQRRAAAAC